MELLDDAENGANRPGVTLAASASLDQKTYKGAEDDAFFKSAQWSADGTTIFTSASSNTISSYIIPEDLLSPRDWALSLRPQGSFNLPEPTAAIAPAPYFSLAEPATHSLLVACRDHPLQLCAAFPEAPTSPDAASMVLSPPAACPAPLASYHLIKPQTEEYLAAASLLWPRPGSGPLRRIPTIPSARHVAKGGGVGMRGTVSALAVQSDSASSSTTTGLVAAGTWTRWAGLYDVARGDDPCVATWSVADAVPEAGGKGIVQAIWSPCGRYLALNERRACGILVYDVRVTGQLLGWLSGRAAGTNQRLSCDVFSSAGSGEDGAGGFEVWAGTENGEVIVWEGVGQREGKIEPSWEWEAHQSAVGSASVHLSGSVVATCSGSWLIPEEGEEAGRRITSEDASLRVWSIGASQKASEA